MKRTAHMVRPEIVFIQQSLNSWKGRLWNPSGRLIDQRTGKPATGARFDIREDPRTGKCQVLVQGCSYHGRKYVSYPDLDTAQAGAQRWARRRFKVDS